MRTVLKINDDSRRKYFLFSSDMKVSKGDSGGVVYNSRREVVGVVSGIINDGGSVIAPVAEKYFDLINEIMLKSS